MKFKLLTALFFSAFIALAQTNKQAQALLEEVEKTTKSFTTQTIAFKNIIDAPTGNAANPRNSRTTAGKALIKGEKFRIELGGIYFIYNGTKTYIVYPDDEEINAFQGEDNEMNLTPTSILARYKKGFSYAMAGKETIDGKTIQYVRLKPKADEEVKEIVIGVDTKTKQLYSFKQFGHDGVITTFLVTSYTTNTSLSDSLFSIKSTEFSGFDIYED